MIEELLSLGVVPIINENDAVTGNKGYVTCGELFSDNDSLASLVAELSDAQLMVLLTDVEGVCVVERNSAVAEHYSIDSFEKNTRNIIVSRLLRQKIIVCRLLWQCLASGLAVSLAGRLVE